MAQGMGTKLTRKKQHEQPHSMADRVAEDNSYSIEPKQRASVTFAPMPPSSSTENDEKQQVEEQHKGFRNDYSIGDTIRSPSHMIIEPTYEKSLRAVRSLNTHDFAFVKRSGGSYSYAILAYRINKPMKGTANIEECMVFAVCGVGSTEMVRARDWSESVRLVSAEGLNPRRVTTRAKTCAAPKCPPLFNQRLEECSMFFRHEIISPAFCQEFEQESDDDSFLPKA